MMIIKGEMMYTKQSSFFLIFLILISTLSVSANASNDDETDEDNFMPSITGYSKFIILDDIVINSQFNSTWESSVTLSDQIGTDLLDDQDLGLRAQIDIHLGNSDGSIDSDESNAFDDLFRQERNWTDSEV